MGLVAETLVEEWLNSKGYFTVRGLKKGVDEIDLLGLRISGEGPRFVHYEVQVSQNPVAYITGNSNARRRGSEELAAYVEEWTHKKFTSAKKKEMRNNVAGWDCSEDWRFFFVHGIVRHEEELHLISKRVTTISISKIISDLLEQKSQKTGNIGREISDLIKIYLNQKDDTKR